MNLFGLLLGAIWRVFSARRDVLLENLALRQQLAALRWHRAGFRWYWSVIFEKLLCKRVGGHCIWPTGVEPQMSNSLDQLLLFDAILHGFPR